MHSGLWLPLVWSCSESKRCPGSGQGERLEEGRAACRSSSVWSHQSVEISQRNNCELKLLDMILRTISRDRNAVSISRLTAVNQLHYKNINKHQCDLFQRMCSFSRICLLSTCGVRLLSTNQQLSRELPSLQDEPKNRKRESKSVYPPFPVTTAPSSSV